MAVATCRSKSGPALHLGGVATALLLGCATPGPPRAPSLRLPEKVTKLEAERVGDEVRLSWENPAKTTDGGGIRGSMTAVVCREGAVPGGGPRGGVMPCTAVRRGAAVPGPDSAREMLPEPLRTGGATLLIYRVEVLNAAGRSAGLSDAVYVAGGEAPPPVGLLSLTPRREAVLVRWAAQDSAVPMEVQRTLLSTAAGPVVAVARAAADPGGQQRKPAGTLKAQGLRGAGGAQGGDSSVTVLTDAATGGKDSGGMIDRTVREADTYAYLAQRVQRITVAGHALELRGVASPAATLVYHDSFPPAAPAGLVSVPGGGFEAPLEIDLSWEPGAEGNLAGYFVYRRAAGGRFVRINQEPMATPAYRDFAVEPGREYVYRVTAVDRLQHESGPSVEVQESLRR